MGIIWNLWHGCKRKSAGCLNCYMFSRDESCGRDPTAIFRTKSFNLPIKKSRDGSYKYPPKTKFYTCFTSDFLLKEADEWRAEAWDMMRLRSDCSFVFLTKRIERFAEILPHDWGAGWPHVTVVCTCENQGAASERLPIFTRLPIRHKEIACAPLLSQIELSEYLKFGIKLLIADGESGFNARPCRYEWVLDLRRQCAANKVSFLFGQTGANFIKDGKTYRIKRSLQHSQAKKAGINVYY